MPFDRLGMPVSLSVVPKGAAFTRYALALLRTQKTDRGGFLGAVAYAENQCRPGGDWSDTPEVATVLRLAAGLGSTASPDLSDPRGKSMQVQSMIKAGVAPGTTSDSTWAAPLALYGTLASEFIGLLRPQTIIGKLNLRRTPFNVRIPRMTTGASAAWVGEGLPSPAAALGFDMPVLTFSKISTIVVLADELVRFSSPAAEDVVRNELAAALVQFEDQQFIDPTVTASAGVHPASITNGAPTVSSTGSTVAAIVADIKSMYALATAANIPFLRPAWILNPRTAIYLSTLLTTGSIPMFSTVGPLGGTLLGIPVIVSANVPIESGGDSFIVLVDASEIFLADDGGITLDISAEATLQSVTNPQTGAQTQVPLWSSNLAGVRANRYCSWTRRNDAGAIVLSGVSY
jgi:HK97 family phage major capsid protein